MNRIGVKYKYLGDKMTEPNLKGATCFPVYRHDGKCIRGKNGSMLVLFENGKNCVVIARLLRKV